MKEAGGLVATTVIRSFAEVWKKIYSRLFVSFPGREFLGEGTTEWEKKKVYKILFSNFLNKFLILF